MTKLKLNKYNFLKYKKKKTYLFVTNRNYRKQKINVFSSLKKILYFSKYYYNIKNKLNSNYRIFGLSRQIFLKMFYKKLIPNFFIRN